MNIDFALGKAIKLRRTELGLSQEELAHRADISRSFMSGVELGDQSPSARKIWALAQALQCKPSDLWLAAERFAQEDPGGEPRRRPNATREGRKAKGSEEPPPSD